VPDHLAAACSGLSDLETHRDPRGLGQRRPAITKVCAAGHGPHLMVPDDDVDSAAHRADAKPPAKIASGF
jgi:hypothetical protein